MKIIKSFNVLNKEINFKQKVGFVPTMGSLHMGHISLIKKSKKMCEKTLVSIFINPTQFNKKTDLINYPKNIKKDIKILKQLKVDYLLMPNTYEVYGKSKKLRVNLTKRNRIMCAYYRPGHFEGVLAVIDQFLKKIKPKYLFLGEKDFQQLYLIRNFIKGKYKTKIISCNTIRDINNIALSSRNILIKKKDMMISSKISNLLINFSKKLKKNIKNKSELTNIYFNINKLKNIKIEYLEIRNKNNLSKVFNKFNFKIFIAYYNKKVRLIDNY